MQALEVGDLGSVAGGHQGFKAGADQLARSTAQHRLLAEEVALGLFLKGGFDDARLEAAERQRIGQGAFERLPGGILLHRHQRRHAHTLGVQLAHAMPRRFGRDHGHVHARRRRDLFEVDIEAVREHEGLARGHVRRNVLVVHRRLDGIGHQDHDHVAHLGGFGGGHNFQPGGFGLGP